MRSMEDHDKEINRVIIIHPVDLLQVNQQGE